MKRTTLALVLAVLATGCGGGGGARPAASTAAGVTTGSTGTGPVTTSVAFRTLEQGDETAFRTVPPAAGAERVAASDAELQLLWTEHTQGQGLQRPRPRVDFTQERVVALFQGERPTGGHGIEVVAVSQVTSGAQTSVTVDFVTRRPTGAATQVVTHPFHVVAIASAQGPITFADVTPAPTTTPLTDVHGELVTLPARAGADTLCFLEDGTSDPREVADPTALSRAGAIPGATLVLTGDALRNVAGITSASEAVQVVSFLLDEVQATGRLVTAAGTTTLRTREGTTYEPLGPLAAALLAAPADRPLRVTGRIDRAHTPAAAGATGLVVTSWRPTAELTLRVAGGLAGLSETFAIDDLPASGAYRYAFSLMIRPQDARAGRGRLARSIRADLEGLVAAASLRTQPAIFRPPFIIMDAPTTYLDYADGQGDVRIQIQAGATLPPAVDALLQRLRALKATVTTFRTLESGSFSQVAQAGVQVVRDARAFAALWQRHAGSGPGVQPPAVDFARDFVVAVFMGRQSSGGHAIEVKSLDRAGDDVYLKVERRSPSGPATTVITAPFHLVLVDHQGATGAVFVDGARVR